MSLLIKLLLKAAALTTLKRELYSRGANTLRKFLRTLFIVLILSQVVLCGLALTFYSLFQLIPLEESVRLYWMLGTGLALVLVPLLLVVWGTSKRVWSI